MNPHTEGAAPKLTPREIQVLHGLCAAQFDKEIANSLGISVRTLEKHRFSLQHKIGANNPVSCVRWAMSNGYITPQQFCNNQ